MQADAPAGGQVPDDGLTHEGVREAEPVESASRTDEPRLLGRLERVERPLGVDAARRRDDLGVEFRARHRRDRQHLGRTGREAGEPPAHDVADARRDRRLGRVALPERPHHLADEERIALRHGTNPRRERRRPPGVGEDRGDVRLGERSELQPADVRLARQPRHNVGEQRGAARLRVAVGGEHEHAHPVVGAQDVLQEEQRQLVRPVQVVEHEQHRRRGARGREQRRGRVQHPQPLDLGGGGRRLRGCPAAAQSAMGSTGTSSPARAPSCTRSSSSGHAAAYADSASANGCAAAAGPSSQCP